MYRSALLRGHSTDDDAPVSGLGCPLDCSKKEIDAKVKDWGVDLTMTQCLKISSSDPNSTDFTAFISLKGLQLYESR